MKSISEFHKEISQIFESRILDIEMKILSIVSDPSIEYSFRPPHPDSFYPCGFSDCVYCLLKIRCEEALEKLNYEVESLKKQYDSSVQEEKELIDESNALELSMSEI